MLAIPDTEISLDLQKVQCGDAVDFKIIYRKFYETLLAEATLLANNQDQAAAVVQLSCIQSWIHCEAITSEQYYFLYSRGRVLRYAQVLSQRADEIHNELDILKKILAEGHALKGQHLASWYEHLTLSQKTLVRQVFQSYFQRQHGNPPAEKAQILLKYAFYVLHYILV